jgi:hypothetical protein
VASSRDARSRRTRRLSEPGYATPPRDAVVDVVEGDLKLRLAQDDVLAGAMLALELRAPVAMIEAGPERLGSRVQGRIRDARGKEVLARQLPPGCAALEDDQALASRQQDPRRFHPSSHPLERVGAVPGGR